MNRVRVWAVLAALALAAPCANVSALSYVMMRDEALLAQSPHVFTARVVRVLPPAAAADGLVHETRYALRVEEAHKGDATGEALLWMPGATGAVSGWRYPGIPVYARGDTLLVFAERRDGVFRPNQLTLGIFRAVDAGGARVFVRDLDAHGMRGKRHAEYAQARDARRFTAWIAATARGAAPPVDYLVPVPDEARAKFSQIIFNFGGAGQFPARWRRFSQGTTVTWFANSDGQAGMVTDEFLQVQQALAAWTNDAGSDIRYAYGGTVAGDTDNVSNVVWNDPLGEIPNSYNCQQGGVLARGGAVAFIPGHTHNSTSYATIEEGNVTVQDGAGCAFDDNGGADGAETMTHEFGHTLGYGHSCGDGLTPACNTSATLDDAVMRATIHGDGRGAGLRADDVAGAAFVYGAAGGGASDPIFQNGFE